MNSQYPSFNNVSFLTIISFKRKHNRNENQHTTQQCIHMSPILYSRIQYFTIACSNSKSAAAANSDTTTAKQQQYICNKQRQYYQKLLSGLVTRAKQQQYVCNNNKQQPQAAADQEELTSQHRAQEIQPQRRTPTSSTHTSDGNNSYINSSDNNNSSSNINNINSRFCGILKITTASVNKYKTFEVTNQ